MKIDIRRELNDTYRLIMKHVLQILNVTVILGSVAIIVFMSLEILSPRLIHNDQSAVTFHFFISMLFLFDFFVRMGRAKRKVRFFFRNFLFFMVSLPFLSFITWFDWNVDQSTQLIVRYLPFFRAIYGFMMVFRYLTRSRITNLFYTYLVLVLATTYFCSLLFFAVEKGVNPDILSFDDALWWALMDMTTCGSNIVPTTAVGRVIAVVLAASGMMLFPIFTVFITNIFKRNDVNEPDGE